MSRFLIFLVPVAMFGTGALAQEPSPSPAADGSAASSSSLAQMVVTGNPLGGTVFAQAQPVSVLSGRELKLKLAPTLGDTLAQEPGVVSSNFTTGAGRPIIRGLDNNRVLVLNNGTSVIDVSNLSPDHAPAVDSFTATQIDVVRGAATLLYGSNAIGGVVNVVDGRIPTEVPINGVSGEVDTRYDSNNSERSSAAQFDLALGKNWVLHLDGSILKAEDIHVPGYALDGKVRAQLVPEQRKLGNDFGGDPRGKVPNTGVFTRSFGIGTSYVWDRGYVGVSYNRFLSVYGVPDDPRVDDPTADLDRVHLDVRSNQFNLRGEVREPLSAIAKLSGKFDYTDYQHAEKEGSATGSVFKTTGFDSRLEAEQARWGALSGTVGVQGGYHDLSVLGDEAFLQPTQTLQLAAFAFEEYALAPFRFQIGGRVEYNRVHITTDDAELTALSGDGGQRQTFVPLSAAASVIADLTRDTDAAFTVRYSERAPTAEELFARGPHDATFQYLIGNPGLTKEKVIGFDLTVRKKQGVVTGSASVFYNHFTDFIDFSRTGEVIDDLDVFNYSSKTANFAGGEIVADLHLLPRSLSIPFTPASHSAKDVILPDGKTLSGDGLQPNPNDLFLEFKSDYVFADNVTDDEPLSRIPPLRLTGAVGFQNVDWSARVEVARVQSQHRTGEFESSTGGYTFLNANVERQFVWGPLTYSLYVRGENLTNQLGRSHQSFLKDVLPLLGRSVVVGLRAEF